jgi:hypothetical protein
VLASHAGSAVIDPNPASGTYRGADDSIPDSCPASAVIELFLPACAGRRRNHYGSPEPNRADDLRERRSTRRFDRRTWSDPGDNVILSIVTSRTRPADSVAMREQLRAAPPSSGSTSRVGQLI